MSPEERLLAVAGASSFALWWRSPMAVDFAAEKLWGSRPAISAARKSKGSKDQHVMLRRKRSRHVYAI